MSDKNLIQERDDLLNAVKEPVNQVTPSNFALYMAIIFANIVFLFLDVISGITVYWLTDRWYYGVLTGVAGFLPLLLHEFLFTRAFASNAQKKIAMVGAGVGLGSIIGVGLVAGGLTVFGGDMVGKVWAEVGVIAALVLIASFHGLLAAMYFYSDLGIRAYQQKAQAIARATQQGDMIDAGDYILLKTQESVSRRKAIEEKYKSPAALQEVLRQMGLDQNNNGIPDFLERKNPNQQFAQTTQQPKEKSDGNGQRP